MWRTFGVAVLLGLGGLWPEGLLAAAAPSGTQRDDPQVICERYAREDGVKPPQMANYLSQCQRDLALDRAYEEEEPDADPIDEPVMEPKPAPPAKSAAPEAKSPDPAKKSAPTQTRRP